MGNKPSCKRCADGIPHTWPHNASSYSNHGCRCGICCAAASADSRERYARKHPNQKFRRWTDEELELAIRPDLSYEEVAEMTGRTTRSVIHKRHELGIFQYRHMSPEQYEFILKSELTPPEIASIVGCTPSHVYTIKTRFGVSKTTNYTRKCLACGADISHKNRRGRWCDECLDARKLDMDRQYYWRRKATQRDLDRKIARERARAVAAAAPQLDTVYRPWTPEEKIEVLRGDISDIEKAFLLNRSIFSIHNMLKRLKDGSAQLNSSRSPMWSNDEIALLKQLPPKQAATATGRSLQTVYSARSRFGLSNELGYNGYNQRKL